MKRIPFMAFSVGVCSFIPLIIMAFFIVIYPSSASIQVLMNSFIGYTAILLSFIGGVNWVLSMQKPVIFLQEEVGDLNNRRLLLAVIPCLIGEGCIILVSCHYVLTTLLILITSFLGVFFYERKSYMTTEVPGGYLVLRWITTCFIETCLVSVLLSRMF